MADMVPGTDPVKAAGQFVLARRKTWEEEMRETRDRWARLEKRYRNYRDDKEQAAGGKVRSNIGIPLAAQVIDVALARMRRDLFSRVPYGRLVPREPGDEPKVAQHQQVINYQQEMTDYVARCTNAIKDAMVFGVGPTKLVYHIDSKSLPVPRMISVPVPTWIKSSGSFDIQVGMKKETKTLGEYPMIVNMHVLDVFFPIDAPDELTAEGFIHRTWQTPGSLRNAKDSLGNPLYRPEDIDAIKDQVSSSQEDPQVVTSDTTHSINVHAGGTHKENKLEHLEYYGKLPEDIEADLIAQHYPECVPYEDWMVEIVQGTEVTLRCHPSPHFTNERPYFFTRVNRETGRLVGTSMIEIVERLLLLVDELYNIIIDNMNVVINKPVYINKTAGMTKAQVIFGPGKVWEGRLPPDQAVKVFDAPDVSQSIWLLIRMLLQHVKEYTGVTDPVLATSSSGEQTAAEFQGLLASAATRSGLHEAIVEETLLKPSMRMWIMFNQQYLTDSFYLRVFKDSQYQFLRVAPEDIQGNPDIIFEGSSKQTSQAIKASQIMQLLQVDGARPVPLYNQPALAEELLFEFEFKDTLRFMNPMYAQQMAIYQQMAVLKALGETGKAITPEQQKTEGAKKSGGTSNGQGGMAGGGIAASPSNAPSPLSMGDLVKQVSENTMPDTGERQVYGPSTRA